MRFDSIGEQLLRDDDLGPAATQLKVVAQLYLGCQTVWYHGIAGGQSRAKILHVQAVDSNGQWQDPTICKLAPIDLLRAEADAHAAFARYIGESVPQRIGEPVYLDEIGGMVLELVGACWRVPELAHTQANLSNTFAETCRYDSDHAADHAARDYAETAREAALAGAAPTTESRPPPMPPAPASAMEERVRDRPVFGEVRIVIDEVLLGQLNTVLMQSAHREPGESLIEHYALLPKITRILNEDREKSLRMLPHGSAKALIPSSDESPI